MTSTNADQTRDHEPSPSRVRGLFWRRLCIVALVLLAVPVVYVGNKIYIHSRHAAVCDQMKNSVHRLAFHRPDGVSEAQWVHCILCSHNLIGNSALLPSWIPTSDLRRIQVEFDSKIDEGPDLKTIGWLWDEFKHSSKIDYDRFRIQWEEVPDDWDGAHEELKWHQESYNPRLRGK